MQSNNSSLNSYASSKAWMRVFTLALAKEYSFDG